MTDREERKAVIYARVANRNPVPPEDRAFTIAGQERCCREHAQKSGYSVIAMFEDIGSGTASNRPGFNAMLAFLHEQREPHTVLIQDPSRLARNTEVFLKLSQTIRQSGGLIEVSGAARSFEAMKDVERERD